MSKEYRNKFRSEEHQYMERKVYKQEKNFQKKLEDVAHHVQTKKSEDEDFFEDEEEDYEEG